MGDVVNIGERKAVAGIKSVRVGSCDHTDINVDPGTGEVWCGACDARLDPATILIRMADKNDRLRREVDQLYQRHRDWRAQVDFICGSCGQRNNPCVQ